MGELQVEVLAARLMRIWGAQEVRQMQLPREFAESALSTGHPVGFRVILGADAELFTSFAPECLFCHFRQTPERYWLCADMQGAITCPTPRGNYQQFIAFWMPFFRRGCWLSGLPVETSAHERAEWMQGVTREELSAWNLCF